MVASVDDIAEARKRAIEWEKIRAGLLPTTRQLTTGAPFYRDDWQADAQAYFTDCQLESDINKDRKQVIAHARETLSAAALTSITDACADVQYGAVRGVYLRSLIYRLAAGDAPAGRQLVMELLDAAERGGSHPRGLPQFAVAFGLISVGVNFTDMTSALDLGLRMLSHRGEAADKWIAAEDETSSEVEVEPPPTDQPLNRDVPNATSNETVGTKTGLSPVPAGVVVVPAISVEGGSRDRQATRKLFKPIAGVALPLVARGDVGAHYVALLRRFPHAGSVIQTLLGDLATREPARFRPTILVGPPGFAKTSLARALTDQLNLPSTLYSAGGVADSSLSGTSAQWSTAGVSVPLQLILQHKVANPCVIVDEIDKASASRHNGSLHDGLLAFLERSTSSAIRDPALEESVDLSWVSWLLTANDVGTIPPPLRDRCRIVHMPRPEWRHVGPLVRSIVDDIAAERDLDRRWIADLAIDELELVRKPWSSGSIRQLRWIVESIIDGREAFAARA